MLTPPHRNLILTVSLTPDPEYPLSPSFGIQSLRHCMEALEKLSARIPPSMAGPLAYLARFFAVTIAALPAAYAPNKVRQLPL